MRNAGKAAIFFYQKGDGVKIARFYSFRDKN